ncbi:hypothetical protein ACJX0J_018281, partial [Zea mays]
ELIVNKNLRSSPVFSFFSFWNKVHFVVLAAYDRLRSTKYQYSNAGVIIALSTNVEVVELMGAAIVHAPLASAIRVEGLDGAYDC